VNIEDKKEISRILMKIKAISFNVDQPFRLTSGLLSPVYVNCRRLMSFPHERARIIDMFENIAETEIGLGNIDVVAGGETAGIPYAAFVAQRIFKPMIYVRKLPKEYGSKKQTEGVLKEGDKVLLVEDLVTDAGSKLNFFNGIKNDGGITTHCMVVFSYGRDIIQERMNEYGVKLFWLTDWNTTLDVALREGYFDDREYNEVKEFISDPSAWSKKTEEKITKLKFES